MSRVRQVIFNQLCLALAGLVLVGCPYTFHKDQTPQAKQNVVGKEEKKRPHGSSSAVVMNFRVKVEAAEQIKPGTQVSGSSKFEIAPSKTDNTPISVEQEFVLTLLDGKAVRAKKAATGLVTPGEYQTDFILDVPDGVPPGLYPLNITLYVNGKKTLHKSLTLQVVVVQESGK